MKNAADHAKTFAAVHRKLVKGHKAGDKPPKIEPLDALIWALLAEDCPDAKAEKGLDALHDVFVDYNELRAAGQVELQELLGARYPRVAERADRLHHVLNAVFLEETALSLATFGDKGKKEQRQYLRSLGGVTPFVEGYVMLYAADASALPMDEAMAGYLADAGAVDAAADVADVQRFCEQHVKADECHAFFQALRAAAFEDEKPRRKTAKKAG